MQQITASMTKHGLIKGHMVIILMFLTYVSAWSIISIGQLYALKESVLDLGVSANQLWSIFNVKTTISETTYNIFFQGIVYLLSPLSYIKGYQILLILQTLAIGATCFPLYGISIHFLRKKSIALVVGGVYLIYFPLAGVNFFTFHFQSFFPVFFTAGYYFYLKEKYFFSLAFFVLSGITRFPFIVFPFIFSILLIVSQIFHSKNDTIEYHPSNKKFTLYLSILFSVSLIFLLLGYYVSSGNSGIQNNLHLSNSINPITNFSNKMLTFALIFAPLLFIPLVSKRWILFYVPFFVLVFFANNVFYEYPVLFQFQYGNGIIPFVFLGLIDGLYTLENRSHENRVHAVHSNFQIQIVSHRLPQIVLLCVSLAALFFQPYGPFNSLSKDNYNIGYKVTFNTTEYNELKTIIGLIPSSDPYVLFQNNMPEFLPRTPIEDLGYLLGGYLDFNYNLTSSMLNENSFPYIAPNGANGTTRIDYVIACMDSPTLYMGDSNMLHLITNLYNSGYYGTRAVGGSLILLERNYTGSAERVGNYYQNMTQVRSWMHGFGISGINNVLSYNSADESFRNVYSPTALYPGDYNITFAFHLSSNDKNSTISCGVNSPDFSRTRQLVISGSVHEKFLLETLSLNLTTFSGFIQFPLSFVNGTGDLQLSFIRIEDTMFNG